MTEVTVFPAIRATMARQSGLITRLQALAHGLTDLQLLHLVRSGAWVRVRRGAYVDAELWATLDPYRGRPRLVGRAARLFFDGPYPMSHDSAAHELGLGLLRPRRELVHVTRPGVKGRRHEFGVKHHRAPYSPAQVMVVDGVPVLDPARTACDITREHGLEAGVVVADQVLRRGIPRHRLAAAAVPMRSWRHVTLVRAAIDLANPGAASPGESLLRLVVEGLGIGEIDCQFPIYALGRTNYADLRVGRHLFEFDGRVKYLDPAHGGVADRPTEQVLVDERRRELALCAQGFGMSRVVWSDLHPDRRAALCARLLAEFAVSRQRFGTTLTPELLANARRARDIDDRRRAG